MDRVSDILVIVDPFVREQTAVAKAAALAKHKYGPRKDFVSQISSLTLASSCASRGRHDGINVTTTVISGDPLHQVIIDWMRHSMADLVVKDTHYHSFAERAFTTNTDWHLIRACPLPLLLTKQTPWGARPIIVAAVDPGRPGDPHATIDHRSLEMAVTLGEALGAQLHAIHAYLPATIALTALGGMPPAGVSANALRAERELDRSRIEALTDDCGICDANLHIDATSASEYLPRAAIEYCADIMIMGAIARSSLERIAIGSTAQRVLEQMPCAMLLVKAHSFSRGCPF